MGVTAAQSSSLSPVRDVRLEQTRRTDWSAAAGWDEPGAVLEHLRKNTNFIEAASQVRWDDLLPSGAHVLDLGCGNGWHAAMLSRLDRVASITAWDGSAELLELALPATLASMGADASKVTRVCGLFTPLLLDDATVDVVTMSSAFHHAPDADALLRDLRRVLRPGGSVVLVNETPWRRALMLHFTIRVAGAALLNLASRDRLRRPPGHVAADYALYDDVLGDRAFTLAQWRALASRNGFALEVHDTGLPSYKPHFRRPSTLQGNLFNLVMRPLPART